MTKYLPTEKEKTISKESTFSFSQTQKGDIKIFIDDMNNCLEKGDMSCADQILKNFKLYCEKKKLSTILYFLQKLEIGIDGFDLLYIQDLLEEMKKSIDE